MKVAGWHGSSGPRVELLRPAGQQEPESGEPRQLPCRLCQESWEELWCRRLWELVAVPSARQALEQL